MNAQRGGNAHPDLPIHLAATEPPVLFGALYWRRSWFGPACPPAILFLRSGWLHLATQDGVLFDALLSSVRMRFTAFGTLKLAVAGRSYALTGSAGITARSLSVEQLQMLSAMSSMPNSWPLNSPDTALYAGAGHADGNALTFGTSGTSYRAVARGTLTSAATMRRWASLLRQQGAS